MSDYASDFFEYSNDLLVISDFHGNFLKVNSAWQKVTGWTPAELTSRPYINFVHPDDRERTIRESSSGVDSDGEVTVFENRYLTKDGGVKTFQWKAAVDLKRQICFAVARDITALRAQQNELFENNKCFEQILDAIDSFILLKDAESRLIWANKGFRQFYGFKEDEHIQGITDKSSADPKMTEKYIKDDLWVVNNRRRLEIPWELCLRSDNQVRKLRVVKSPIFDESGNVIMTVGVSQDITDKLNQEDVIKQQEAQMIHASRMSSVGEMAAGIAHEINNPLTIIGSIIFQAQSKVAKGDFSPELLSSSFERINKSLDRIARIVRSLRFLSRDSGNDPFTSIPLNSIFQDTSELCQEKFRFGEVDLRVKDCGSLSAFCRPSEIGQVLLNLISNSFDAVKGDKKAWVQVNAQLKEKAIEVEVIDSGGGISSEIAEKMMNPFFTTKEIGQGTGLGLSIAYSIVRSHGSELKYDPNCPNTRFYFQLPIEIATKYEEKEL